MTRAILALTASSFLLAAAGCTPELTREEGDLQVTAVGLPPSTVGLDLVLLRADETRRLSFPASGAGAQVGLQGLAAGPLTVRAECMGENSVLLASREAQTTIQAGRSVELRFEFGASADAGVDDLGNPDAAEPGIRSARIVHTVRLREDDVSAGQLRGNEMGNGLGIQSFWTQAETQLGATPTRLMAAEVDLQLESSSGVSHFGQLYTQVELVLRGLDTQSEVVIGQASVSGSPTLLPLNPTGSSLIPLQAELTTSRFELIVRGSTPASGGSDFEAFVAMGFVLSASL